MMSHKRIWDAGDPEPLDCDKVRCEDVWITENGWSNPVTFKKIDEIYWKIISSKTFTEEIFWHDLVDRFGPVIEVK